MDAPEGTALHPVVTQLDATYAALIANADALKQAFFATARDLHKGKPGHIPIAIRLCQSSPNAVSIVWVKIILGKAEAGASEGTYLIQTINKGRGHKYPLGAFSFVKEPLKQIVRAYEVQLAEIREACSVNQKIRRQLIPHARRARLIDDAIGAFLAQNSLQPFVNEPLCRTNGQV